jgi:hypothetical protein
MLPNSKSPQRLRNSPLDENVSPTRVKQQLREVFREAFDQLGGVAWLVEFAQRSEANQRVFVQALSKLLPPSSADKPNERIIIDIPWLTRERLSYKNPSNPGVPLVEDISTATDISETPG